MLTDDEHREAMQRMQDAANELREMASEKADRAVRDTGRGHDDLAKWSRVEERRLRAKASGVLLALDYLRSYAWEADR